MYAATRTLRHAAAPTRCPPANSSDSGVQASGTDAETTSTTNPHPKNDANANANANAFLVKDLHTRKSHENGEIGWLLADPQNPTDHGHETTTASTQSKSKHGSCEIEADVHGAVPSELLEWFPLRGGVKADEYKQAGEREYEQRETSRHTLATARDIHKAGNVDEMRNEQ
ncbi:hypothetical protein PLEOSDRAFT_1105343 [Pleurotus ostreatus PC15]|uniref:Uncharacterized protein n=1 Tax=Pleurotus ostreatus (strain PC15) TaxID=1137138 RepID=A0A067NF24_PLEO1|nr:hypothetical protein PLEOSDRAFT_1105343 [Pleurotus ostreatus PC15]